MLKGSCRKCRIYRRICILPLHHWENTFTRAAESNGLFLKPSVASGLVEHRCGLLPLPNTRKMCRAEHATVRNLHRLTNASHEGILYWNCFKVLGHPLINIINKMHSAMQSCVSHRRIQSKVFSVIWMKSRVCVCANPSLTTPGANACGGTCKCQ